LQKVVSLAANEVEIMTSQIPSVNSKPSSFSPIQLLLLLGIIVFGALLRFLGNNQPFPSSDHAEVAAIISFFYPRDFQMFIPSQTSFWNIFTSAHGVLLLLISLIWISFISVFGIHINEFWWNVPFALISLASIPLAAVLIRRIAGNWAGVLGAFLVSLIPIYVVMARASGISHIPLTLECQMLTLLMLLRYVEMPNAKRARHLSIALTLNLLVELLFPILFILVLGAGVLAVGDKKGGRLSERINAARSLLFTSRIMGLPILVLLFNFSLMILYVRGFISMGGIATRLLAGSDRQPGLHLNDFIENIVYVSGWLALLILLFLAIMNWKAAKALKLTSLALYWSILYLVPFIVFSRPHVFEYFLLGIAPLVLNAAIVLSAWFRSDVSRKLVAGILTTALALLLGARCLSMVFGVTMPEFIGNGKVTGAVFEDQGLKAAAWWVRERTEPNQAVFADWIFEPYQMSYYFHRPFVAATDAEQPSEAYQLLEDSPKAPSYYLVLPGNEPLLRSYVGETLAVQATVMVDNHPVLLIFGEGATEAEVIQAEEANQLFDQQFGSWRSMFSIGTNK
jgi:hypothetical protein